MCDKKGYSSEREANEALNMGKHHRTTGNRRLNKKKDKRLTRKYWCEECTAWHLTSKRND